MQDRLPVWIAVGGTPQSVARAGAMGLPLAVAIIGGDYARFAPFFELYREAARRSGHDPKTLATSINVHGSLPIRPIRCRPVLWPQAAVMDRLGRERGWPPTNRAQFDRAARRPAISSSAIPKR